MRSSSTTITLPYLLITSVMPAIKLFAKPQFFSRSTMVTALNPVTVCIYLRSSSTPFIAFSFFAPSEKIKRSESFAKGHPQVRVDFYIVEGKVIFGEMTFTSQGGYMDYLSKDYSLELGKMMKI